MQWSHDSRKWKSARVRKARRCRPLRLHLPSQKSSSALSIPDTQMALTMLGKRRRCDDHDATALTSSKTSGIATSEVRPRKRQLRSTTVNDENAPPIFRDDDTTLGDRLGIEELDDPFSTCGSLSSRKWSPGKSTSRSSQVEAVTTKINGHFKTSKPITRMYTVGTYF
jgi:hypothetical protein